jgi:cyclic dehypoxanthinyl futalosine synthase
MARYKVACVGYTNAWPLTRHLDPARFDVFGAVPSEAARKLKNGEADVGLIPVASLLSDGDYRVVPGLAIGCDGDVASVLLIGDTPLEEWDAVALDGESRTSVVLAQILLRGPLGRPDLRVFPVDAGTGAFHAQGKTGAVVIGDAARNLPARITHRIDLGQVWKKWTGLPFVFAVWAGRPDLDPDAIAGLRESAAKGLPERATAPAADRTYLTEHIRYTLDDRALMGLRRFAALGKAAGFFRTEDVSLYGPPRRARSRTDLDTLLARGAEGGRLGYDDGLRLATEGSIQDLGSAAHLRRMALHPRAAVTYTVARHVDPADTVDHLAAKLFELVTLGGTEAWVRGGDAVGLERYEGLLRWIKAGWPAMSRHASSPADVLRLAEGAGLSVDATLDRLVAAGLDGIAGAPGAIDGPDLDVLGRAHVRGLRSVVALPFGTGETAAARIAHLLRLRDLQDAYGGITAAFCWAPPERIPGSPGDDTAADYLRVDAVARLFLDNVETLQASQVGQGQGVAQAALYLGCNALGDVVLGEKDGNGAALIADAERTIRTAGFVPVRRTARPEAPEVRGAQPVPPSPAV